MKPEETDTFQTRTTLLSKVRRGDEAGWSRFYRFYADFIQSAARASGLSREEAKDVMQETMLTVRDYIQNFVPDKRRARFRTWLRKIVQSRIADQHRRRKRNPLEQVQRGSTAEGSETTATTNRLADPNEVDLERLIDGKLEEALLAEARRRTKAKVSAEHYQTYDLFAGQGLSAKEVGYSLGISPVTVRLRTLRVRRVIAQELRHITKLLGRSNPT